MTLLLIIYLLIWCSLSLLTWAFIYGAHGGRIPWRRWLFGWVCRMRGQHVARKPFSIWTYSITSGKVLNFRCLCGEVKSHWVDEARGGRVPVPFGWRDMR